jgi:tetratricopeptide (TPR) repeat protein
MSSSEFGGTIKWMDSLGQTTPITTGVQGNKEEEGKEADEEIYEIKKAAEEMKPILVFFYKPKDLLAFGNKAQKDPEVDACTAMDEDLWKRIAITERAKEFTCVRVNVRKADAKQLAKHRVSRAPVVAILSFNLKQLYFSPAPKVSWSAFGKVMDMNQGKVEADVKKLATKTEDTAEIQAAKKRAQVIEQRETYKEALELLDKKKYDESEAKFKKVIEIAQDSEWKKEAQVGLVEIKAAKMYEDADNLYTQRKFKECKEACEKILKECKEAKYHNALVQELKKRAEKKLS